MDDDGIAEMSRYPWMVHFGDNETTGCDHKSTIPPAATEAPITNVIMYRCTV